MLAAAHQHTIGDGMQPPPPAATPVVEAQNAAPSTCSCIVSDSYPIPFFDIGRM